MKEFKIGNHLIRLYIANGNKLSDKYFAEYNNSEELGGVYIKKYFAIEKRHYLASDTTVLWVIIWCFVIGIGRIK